MRFLRKHRRGLLALVVVAILATATWAADTKLSALSALAAADDDDLIYIVDEPNGVPAGYKIGRDEFLASWAGSASITTLGTVATGSVKHEAGGLEADVSAYNGFVKIAGGTTSAVTAHAGTDLTADLEEEVTEGSLANSTIVSGDIKDGEVAAADCAANMKAFGFNFIIDGGGSAITTGVKGDLELPFAGTITSVRLLADQSGSIVVDLWKDTYANFPATDADTITSATPPTITTATKSEDETLTTWTTSFSAGEILRFNVDSCTTITRCTVSIRGTKS